MSITGRTARFFSGNGVIALIIAIGALLRIGWIVTYPARDFALGEATNVAIAFATTGVFGDTYFPGQGPTAHLMPTTPLIAGYVFKTFGVFTPSANFILGSWSLIQVFSSYILLFYIFGKLNVPRLALLAALAFLSLIPIFFGYETFVFRYWEGALGVNLAAANLIFILRMDEAPKVTHGAIVAGCLLAAVTFFVSPPLGLGVYAAWAIFLLRHVRGPRLPEAVTVAVVALLLVLAPWTVRNMLVLGEAIPLRDNAGLELALANYPGAVSPADPLLAFQNRIDRIHPLKNPKLHAMLKQPGSEAAYARRLGNEAKAWIRAHPAAFMQIAVRHIRQFYFPSLWEFLTSGQGRLAPLRSLLVSTVSALGMIGLLYGLFSGVRSYAYIAAVVLMAGLPYAFFQPVPRYTYLVYGLLVFLAADGLARLHRRFSP